MLKEICYRKDNNLVVAIKDVGWVWGVSEMNENPFAIVELDLSQEKLDDIEINGIPIQDLPSTGCLVVNDPSNPTNLVRGP